MACLGNYGKSRCVLGIRWMREKPTKKSEALYDLLRGLTNIWSQSFCYKKQEKKNIVMHIVGLTKSAGG